MRWDLERKPKDIEEGNDPLFWRMKDEDKKVNTPGNNNLYLLNFYRPYRESLEVLTDHL